MCREKERSSSWPDGVGTMEDSPLGSPIHFVPDDFRVEQTETGLQVRGGGNDWQLEPGVVYHASEALALAAVKPGLEELCLVHQVKQIFGGEIASITPRPRKQWTEAEVTNVWSRWDQDQRQTYTDLRLRALALLGATEERATLEQRITAASWSAERVMKGDLT